MSSSSHSQNTRGSLFVVSAPSGAGKTTLCRRLTAEMTNINHSVSCTTRPPRPGEVDGRDYIFLGVEQFEEMAQRGEFAEWARVHGNLYGTGKKTIEDMLGQGRDVILDVDVQGASSLREVYAGEVHIFILPPSMTVLAERLTDRQSDSNDVIAMRLKQAKEEIREYKNYDYVIINDELEAALNSLRAIVLARRSRTRGIEPGWVEREFLS